MQLLKDRIRKDGKIKEGNVLKVDSFLNHQMDVKLFQEIGKEFKRRFEGEEITKLLGSESHVLRLKYLMYRLYLQRRHRQRILQGMYIQQR